MKLKKYLTHLHVHSEFSILDSPISIRELVEKTAEMEFPSVGLTDHGSMCGTIRFQKDADDVGVKPIFGSEIYLTNTDLDQEISLAADERRGNYSHLVLLAENNIGLQSLTRITSRSAMEGFYYRPRADFRIVAEEAENLFCLTACLSGPVSQAILDNDLLTAFRRLKGLYEIFGDKLYFEIQLNEMEEQKKVNSLGIQMAKKLCIPLVYTADVHYLEKKDNEIQDMMVLMRRGKTISEAKNEIFTTRRLFLKTIEDICQEYVIWGKDHLSENDLKSAITNTLKIDSMCNARFKVDDYQYPVFDSGDLTVNQFFVNEVKRKFSEMYIPKYDFPIYTERLQKEMSLIIRKKLASYFLIINDITDFAKANKILVGPGRGSAGGCLVAYVLGITAMDPIRFGLSFERFLSEERAELPDFDLDFCDWGRQLIIEYLSEKYGQDKVFPIISFAKMQARSILRDVGKVLEIPGYEIGQVTKYINEGIYGKGHIIPALRKEKRFMEFFEKYPDLVRIAEKLEGKVHHMSRHAAGVVVTPVAAKNFVPLVKSGGIIHCGFDYDPNYLSLDMLKVLKIDILGLTTLSIIDKALKLIKERNQKFDEDYFWKLDDPDVYREIQKGNTIGSFQMESWGFRNLLQKIQPTNFNHLVAAVALFRPSTLAANIHMEYVKKKKVRFKCENPVLGAILDETYGTMIYQEQTIALSAKLGNLTPGEADLIRRALTKWQSTKLSDFKGKKQIEQFEGKFIEGAISHGLDEEAAREIFEQMKKFSLYAFNRSHSTGYAIVAYQTMYLKIHYPLEFFLALMQHTPPGQEYKGKIKLNEYINEVRRNDIEVLPPNIDKSGVIFEIDGSDIRAGLSLVKWVGEGPANQIIENRPFESFDDFLERTGNVNSRALRSLLAAGCFPARYGARRSIFEKLREFKKFEHEMDDLTRKECLFGLAL